jgi:hypothetical protein
MLDASLVGVAVEIPPFLYLGSNSREDIVWWVV